MKKVLVLFAACAFLAACDDENSNQPPMAQEPTVNGGPIVVGGDGSEDGDFDQYMYKWNGQCDAGESHQYLTNYIEHIYLGETGNSLPLLAEIDLYLKKDGTYTAKYVEFENQSHDPYHIMRKENGQHYKVLHMAGLWRESGGEMEIDDLGVGRSTYHEGDTKFGLKFTRSIYSDGLIGKQVILSYVTSNNGPYRDCAEESNLGMFWDYRYYHDTGSDVFIGGLAARETRVGVVGNGVINWDFKLLLFENGTFEFREMINRVPEAGVSKSTYWDGEDGEWGLVDETLVLGDLGRLDIENGEVILTFFRNPDLESDLLEGQFLLRNKSIHVEFERGYLEL